MHYVSLIRYALVLSIWRHLLYGFWVKWHCIWFHKYSNCLNYKTDMILHYWKTVIPYLQLYVFNYWEYFILYEILLQCLYSIAFLIWHGKHVQSNLGIFLLTLLIAVPCEFWSYGYKIKGFFIRKKSADFESTCIGVCC